MKLLLITPPYHAGVVESAGRWMPLSLAYLGGAAREAGFEVEIYDAMTRQHTQAEVERRIQAYHPDVIGITAITASLPACLEVLRRAKALNPRVKTIMGGVHPTFCARELLQEHAEVVDVVVQGEGEPVLPRVLRALEQGSPLDDVPGVAFRKDGEIVNTGRAPLIQDLDALPAAWELISWEDYDYFVIPGSTLAAVSTSRGCTHGCTFCSQQKFWQQTWRSRSPESVVTEIEMLNVMYGANVFLIVDEYPTCDRERWEEILERIILSRLDAYFLIETRVEDIVRDADILGRYRTAGVVHIYIGVEATSQETLDAVKKDISVEESREAIRLIRDHGMISETSFVLGFPWETEETIRRTLEMAQHYSPDFAHFLAITPWPYADLWEEVQDRIEVHDYGKYNLVEPIIAPTAMSREQVRRAIVDCYRQYYMSKAHDFLTEQDPFKREYLKRSMKLIMHNSFLTQLMKRNGYIIDFDRLSTLHFRKPDTT